MNENTATKYAALTAAIVEKLEAGVAPWVRPWTTTGLSDLPTNIVSERHYHGGNVLSLWVAQTALGYPTAEWVTFKQARDLGGTVRKGEHGAPIFFVSAFERDDDVRGKELVALQPLHDRGVVGRGAGKGRERKGAAGLHSDRAVVRVQLGEQRAVLVGTRDDRDPRVVLGRGARHRGAADVDRLDIGALLERIEVRHDELEGQDAVEIEVATVALVAEIGEEATVDFRVQGLYAAIEHLGRPGH